MRFRVGRVSKLFGTPGVTAEGIPNRIGKGRVLPWAAAIILSSVLASWAPAQSYTITDLGTADGIFSEAWGINASGQVTGEIVTSNDEYHAFLYSNGTMQDLGTLGGTFGVGNGINALGQVTGESLTSGNAASHAFIYGNGTMHDIGSSGATLGAGINDSGQVAGVGGVGSGPGHAIIYTNGAITDLGTLGGNSSEAYGINNAGQVTGQAYLSGNATYHAFLYTNGSMKDLGTLGAPGDSIGHGINNLGDVTGEANLHAFLYANGTMQDLGTLGGEPSQGWGINDAGQVVGDSAMSSGATHAFLYTNGSMQDLNSLLANPNGSWVLESATAINDFGQITGYGTLDGQEHAFLLAPTTPEPGSIAVMAVGAIALLARGRRK